MTGPVIVDEPGKSALCIGRVMLKKEKDVGGVCRRNCAGYLGESLLPALVTERMPRAPQQKNRQVASRGAQFSVILAPPPPAVACVCVS